MSNTNGVILLGGQSTRMGKNKIYLKFNNKSFLEKSVGLLQELKCQKILLSGVDEKVALDLRKVDNLEFVLDKFTKIGPISGVNEVLNRLELNSWVLFIPIDMPLLTKKVIKYLVSYKVKLLNSNIIYYKGYVFPFLLKNTVSIRKVIYKNIQVEKYALKHLFNDIKNNASIELPEKYIKHLVNINTPKDYELL